MKALIFVMSVVLAGCASRAELRSMSMSDPPLSVCTRAALAGYDVAREEAAMAIHARGIDCAPYMPLIAARAQGSSMGATGLMLMEAGRAKPAPMPATRYCQTTAVGNTLRTICD